MLLLLETPAGFALLIVEDEGDLSLKLEDLYIISSPPARRLVLPKAFCKLNFSDPSKGLSFGGGLHKFLLRHCKGQALAAAESNLADAVRENMEMECVYDAEGMEKLRDQIREEFSELAKPYLNGMSLRILPHLDRYKLGFSSQIKVEDSMVVQAIRLLNGLDKELNTNAALVLAWYGWHFPELSKFVQDDLTYAKIVKLMGNRCNTSNLDLSEFLSEEAAATLKEVAIISIGTELSDTHFEEIRALCDHVLALSECKVDLCDYIKSLMNKMAPNLTDLVGELVGARLISHSGSLLNLACLPGSTIQFLGARKARKTKGHMRKCGYIYHAPLVCQASFKTQNKISRSFAAKLALAIRYDAFGDGQNNSLGLEYLNKLEARLKALEGSKSGGSAKSMKKQLNVDAEML